MNVTTLRVENWFSFASTFKALYSEDKKIFNMKRRCLKENIEEREKKGIRPFTRHIREEKRLLNIYTLRLRIEVE